MGEATAVRLRFQLANGAYAKPTFYLVADLGPPFTPVIVGDHQAIADDVRAAVVSSGLMANYPSGTRFEACEVQNVRRLPPDPPTYPNGRLQPFTALVESDTTEIDGSASGEAGPPQLAAVWSFKTALAGKSRRGRAYLPAGNEATFDSAGNITSAWRTSMLDDLTVIILAALAAPVAPPKWAVISPLLDVATEITTSVVRDVVRTQRRRAS